MPHFTRNLDQNARKSMIALLNQSLADAIDLKMSVKQAHWNIKGPDFIALHKLFDEQAATLDKHGDVIAERCVILGGTAEGTTQEVTQHTRLDGYLIGSHDQEAHIRALTDRYMGLGANVREAIQEAADAGDDDTADLLTALSRDLDKGAWFIGAHLGETQV